MKNLSASVVIPTFNKQERLALTLESFNHQKASRNVFEVIVVDDGSTDGTEEFVNNFDHNFKLLYKRQNNSGRSSARNNGILEAKNDIIIFCDDDLIVSKDLISEHLNCHEDNVEKVVHGRIYTLSYMKFFKNPSTGTLYDNADIGDCYITFLKRFLITKEQVRNTQILEKQKKVTYFESLVESTFKKEVKELQWLCFTGGNVSCTKKVLDRVGLFDETFGSKWGCEDLEMGYRIARNNVGFVYSHEAFNYHIAHFRTTFREELSDNVNQFYAKYNDPCILNLDKLLLGEVKDIGEYMKICESNGKQVKELVF
jgi:glycosyltransferase involved in cell wall biosynthesis